MTSTRGARVLLADIFLVRNTLGQQFRQLYTAKYGGLASYGCKRRHTFTTKDRKGRRHEKEKSPWVGVSFVAYDVRTVYGDLISTEDGDDHLWLQGHSSPEVCGIAEGDLFKFTAVVKLYQRHDGSRDYTLCSLNHLKRITEEERVYEPAPISYLNGLL